jgi:signal transduction histidine kinase
VYFAVAECLSNIVKHSGASAARVAFESRTDRLRVVLTDDGRGGIDPAKGSGLRGIAERLEAVDGRLEVVSPAGGPTGITIVVPLTD